MDGQGWALLLSFVVSAVIVGVFLDVLPSITRRGLLFGVYVGEGAEGRRAREIRRAWHRGLRAGLLGAVAAGVAVGASGRPLAGGLLAHGVLLALVVVLYLRAHGRARALAAEPARDDDRGRGSPPGSLPASAASTWLPLLTLIAAMVMASVSMAYSWVHLDVMPERVPVHFDFGGRPDAWADRSFLRVMLLPLVNLAMAVVLGGTTMLISQARLSVRTGDGSARAAQLRFRRAVTRYMAVITLLTTGMMTLGAVSSTHVALGRRAALHPGFLALGFLLASVAIGGVVYLMIRYGQGGARLEEPVDDERIVGPLADDRHWVLGVLYVNRRDPAWLVEKRFGLGYTVNFGNPRVVAALIGFSLLILGLVLLSVGGV